MKVEVIRAIRYYADGFTLSMHSPSNAEVTIPDDIAKGFIESGACVPFSTRETKPLKADIEIKSNKRASTRTRKSSRAKIQPSDN